MKLSNLIKKVVSTSSSNKGDEVPISEVKFCNTDTDHVGSDVSPSPSISACPRHCHSQDNEDVVNPRPRPRQIPSILVNKEPELEPQARRSSPLVAASTKATATSGQCPFRHGTVYSGT